MRLTNSDSAKLPENATAESIQNTDPDSIDQPAHAIDVPELPMPDDPNIGTGRAIIKIQIDASGKAESVEIIETTLPETYMAALVETFLHAIFSPATLNGKAVSSSREIEIIYGDPDEAEKKHQPH